MSIVLSVQNLTKVYPGNESRPAADRISFNLHQGEILGFLGPNGSGKTTTIQMLLGTLTKTSGNILYFGKEFSDAREEILNSVSFASTYLSLPYILTIEENLEVIGLLYGISRKESKRRFMPLLERFGIASYAQEPVSVLSAGQVTRLIIVKAFFMEPKIVLLDEPTASLDPDVSKDICEFLLEKRDQMGLSILFTSHKMGEVASICDRVIFLSRGKIVADDLPDNLVKGNASCKLRLVLLENVEKVIHLAAKQGHPHTVDHRSIEIEMQEKEIPVFLNILGKEEIVYSGVQIQEPSLDDYFLKIARESKRQGR